MKIAVFHHLLPVNDWELLYSEQMHRLCTSGLYNEAEFIHIGFNCLEQNLPFTLEKIRLNRNPIHTDDIDTLMSLYNFCLDNPDYKVLYFTNLGVTKNHPITRLNKSGWRLMLEYFNIDNWKQCAELLDKYDCVGAEGHFGVPDKRPGQSPTAIYTPHYSGNWWWAAAKRIKSLDINYISRNSLDGIRERAESWIGSNDNARHYNLYSSGHYGGLYEYYVKPTEYIK